MLNEVVFTGKLDVFSISKNQYLRTCGKKADVSELGDDEYFCFSMCAQNNGTHTYTWEQAYVCVDGAEPWHWAGGQLPVSQSVPFYIAYTNMKKCVTPGVHTVVWYIDGQAVHQERFVITKNMKWETVFPVPSRQEIEHYPNRNRRRSPYIYAFLDIAPQTRYTEYMIDFKVSHLPKGTYCCLGCWRMDHSSLQKQSPYASAEADWPSAYAGFQKIGTGQTVSIMSFWDVHFKDALGNQTTIRAKRLYPQTVIDGGRFEGEGTGARSSAPFAWEANHWYRMHLKSIASHGKTLVEQWVCDIETGKYTLLCRYDIGIANSSFQGSIGIFLENFLPETAGEIRSMEVCNARYRNADTKQWTTITEAYIASQGGAPVYEGSYNFGVSDNRIWMITSGVGGDWFRNGKGKRETTFTIADN